MASNVRRLLMVSALAVLLVAMVVVTPAVAVALPMRLATAVPVTAAFLDSEANDPLFGGAQVASGNVSIDSADEYNIHLRSVVGPRTYYLTFGTRPTNLPDLPLPLEVGVYEGAWSWPGGPGNPGIEISSDIAWCGYSNGRFIIDELAYDGTGGLVSFSARFEFHCNAGEPATFGAVSYNATAPFRTRTNEGALSFGALTGGQTSTPQSLTITNNGPANLSIGGLSLGGGDASQFSLTTNSCAGAVLNPAQSCTATVTFSPTGAPGTRSAKLTFFDDIAPSGGGGSGRDIVLSGELYVPPDPFGEYTGVTPARVFDTRNGVGQGGVPGTLHAGEVRDVQITGEGGLPATGVAAVVMNVTVSNPSSWGWLRVWPAGEEEPAVSNLNFVAGQTVANLVTVPVGADGKVSIRSANGTTDVVFDVVGSYADSDGVAGSRFHGITPVRFLDTRVPGAPIGPGGTLPMKFTGTGGVPSSGVTAVALNVTVTQPTSWGWLTVYPGDASKPLASSINFFGGQTVANMVIVRVPADGIVNFFNQFGTTQVIADVMGYYDNDRSTEAGRFIPVSPDRTFDSREGFGALEPDSGVVITWEDDAGQPLSALGGIVANVTATQPTAAGWITAFPLDASEIPWVSNLNFSPGWTVPNQVMVRTSLPNLMGIPAASVVFYNPYGYTHLIVDLFGFFTNASASATPAASGISAATSTLSRGSRAPVITRSKARTEARALLVLLEYAPWDSNPEPAD